MVEKRHKQNRHPVMWVITIALAAMIFFPLLIVLFWSFANSWTFPSILPQEWGLHGYETVLSIDPHIVQTTIVSIALSLVVATICVLLSLLVGHALAFYGFKGKHVIDFLTFLPVIIPATAFGMGLHVTMLKVGWANTFQGVILIHVIVMIPYTIKILTDSLRLFGRHLSEQAWSFGASPMQAFLHVALPPLLPSIITAFSIAFIGSFGQYFLTLIIGGGKIKTLALVMFSWINGTDRALAAAFAVIYVIASLAVFWFLDAIGTALSKNRKTYLM